MTTWADVRHQAQRCRRLRDPDDKKKACRLWFVLVREVLDASLRARALNDQVVPCEGGNDTTRRDRQ